MCVLLRIHRFKHVILFLMMFTLPHIWSPWEPLQVSCQVPLPQPQHGVFDSFDSCFRLTLHISCPDLESAISLRSTGSFLGVGMVLRAHSLGAADGALVSVWMEPGRMGLCGCRGSKQIWFLPSSLLQSGACCLWRCLFCS